MIKLQSQLPSMQLEGKTVFLRADLNVPLKDATIVEDYRLKQIKPTLDYLLERQCKILLATHIGRPTEQEARLSTQVLVPWFKEHGYTVSFASSIEQAKELMQEDDKNIVLLENLRFFPGETLLNNAFAHELKELAEVYITDAYGTLHRDNTSVSKLPYLFEKNERAIGFLIEKELAALNKLLEAPKKPFLMIIGGGKVKDKIPLIQNLFPLVDQIALCPAIVYTFLKAFNYKVGDSLVDEHFTTKVCDLAQQAQELHVQLWLPPDFLVEENGQLSIVPIGDFAPTARGVSFGPKTVEAWTDSINKAGTIFLNGLPGRLSKPETLTYYNELVKIVADSPAYTVIGGGDSVGAALKLNLQDKINYLSTGGGATLIYLSGEPLPGLQPFE